MSWVLFFDGECGFCSRSVRWVARLDTRGRVFFAPLQGKLAREMDFTKYAAEHGGTMVLLREPDGAVFLQSDGWAELANALGGGWQVFSLVRWIPRFFRDAVYGWVARHRYRFFGKSDSCSLPDAELVKRMRE